jgi:hypothetical protein
MTEKVPGVFFPGANANDSYLLRDPRLVASLKTTIDLLEIVL